MIDPNKITDQQLALLAHEWWKCINLGNGLEDIIYSTIDSKFFLISDKTRSKIAELIHEKVKEYLLKLASEVK